MDARRFVSRPLDMWCMARWLGGSAPTHGVRSREPSSCGASAGAVASRHEGFPSLLCTCRGGLSACVLKVSTNQGL